MIDEHFHIFNGFDAGDVVNSPPYVVEEILRTDLGIATAGIDYGVFDDAGNDTDGDIENTLNVDSKSLNYLFSIYDFTTFKPWVQKLCKQSGMFFWFSGSSKAKVVARRRSYTAVVDTIDYNDVTVGENVLGDLEDVVNEAVVHYAYNYGSNENELSVDSGDDADLQDTDSQTDYNKIYITHFRADYIKDEAVAIGLGEAMIDFFASRPIIIEIEATSARYNALEICDVVNIDNWDSNYDIFGSSITSSVPFMVILTEKSPETGRFLLMQVAGTIA